jgi:hypothetical protein
MSVGSRCLFDRVACALRLDEVRRGWGKKTLGFVGAIPLREFYMKILEVSAAS